MLSVNANFLAAMELFSSCSWWICLVVSTDTKLDKSHPCITCFAVFFSWAFAILISFCIILYFLCIFCFWWKPYGQSETHPVPWSFKRISKMSLLEILISLAYWFIFLAIFTIFILISLEFSLYEKKKKKDQYCCRKTFAYNIFCFKTQYFDWSMWGGWKLLYGYFWRWSRRN